MDRKTQVRAIIAREFPQLDAEQQDRIIELVWKEAQREFSLKAGW